MTHERYGERYFGGDSTGEGERLAALAEVFDGVSRAALERAGVRAGWRCLEVGAGGGSVARWLAGRVGPGGSVVAVDRETRFLAERPDAGITAVEAALTAGGVWPDEVAEGGFDLLHTRMTVMHQPDRPGFLRRLAALLRPGGVLVASDTALIGGTSSVHDGYRATMVAMARFMADSIGSDTDYGRHYPSALAEAGLTDLTLAADVPVADPGGPLARFWELTVRQVAPRLVAGGYATAAEVGSALRHLTDPAVRELSFVLCTATGRRPG